VATLQAPAELLDLKDGEAITFRVLRWEEDAFTIFPPHAPGGKTVRRLRVHVPLEDKPEFPHYWDFTAVTLTAQLAAHLARPDLARLRFTVTARGLGPKKRFQVEIGLA